MAEYLSSTQLDERLREILQTWPLYRTFEYTGAEDRAFLPQLISLFCPECKKVQKWETQFWGSIVHKTDKFHETTYTCRNCRSETVYFYYYWGASKGTSAFLKAGQYPPLEDRPSIELASQLDAEDLDFYSKALRCRNFNYGLAALAYLRRVVENRMNDLLDLLGEIAKESQFAAEDLPTMEQVKQSRRFDDKVTYAAKILPPHLRPAGQNPIDLLHDLASEGIHAKSDEECIEVFDRSKLVFEYVFRELRLRKEDAKEFVKALRELGTRKSPAK